MELRAKTGEIRKRQVEQGVTDREIAREYGCSPQFVGQVIKAKKTSAPLWAFIERRLKARHGELFSREDPGKAA